MGCKQETRVIGEHSYFCLQWDAEKSLLMKFKLAQAFGGAFADIAAVISAEGSDKDMSGIFNKLFKNSSPEAILALMKTVVESATCDLKRITVVNFNDIFGDNLMEFYKAFAFVLEVNYKNFLGDKLVDALGKALQKSVEEKKPE